jgi:hypothetical protein
MLLVTNFIKFKINPIQLFEDAHKHRMCVYVFIGVCDYNCISTCVFFLDFDGERSINYITSYD